MFDDYLVKFVNAIISDGKLNFNPLTYDFLELCALSCT